MDAKSYNNESYFAESLLTFAELRENEKSCDISLLTSNKKIKAHKVVLASSSKYFKNVIYGLFLNDCTKSELKLNEIQYDILLVIVDYMYTGRIEINAENVYDIYNAADCCLLDFVKMRCLEFLLENLNADNCVKIWSIANNSNYEELRIAAENIFFLNFEVASNTSDFLNLTRDELLNFLGFWPGDKLFDPIISSVLKWAADKKHWEDTFIKIFKDISFTRISDEYLENVLPFNELLQNSFICNKWMTNIYKDQSRLCKLEHRESESVLKLKNSQLADSQAELTLKNFQLEELEAKLKLKNSKLAEYETVLKSKNLKLATSEAELKLNKSKIAKLEDTLKLKNTRLSESESELNLNRSQLAEFQAELKLKNSKIAEFEDEKQFYNSKLSEFEYELKLNFSELSEFEDELKLKNSKLSEFEAASKLNNSKLTESEAELKLQNSKLAALNAELKLNNSKLSETKHELEIKNSMLAESKAELKLNYSELALYKSELKLTNSKVAIYETELKLNKSSLTQFEDELKFSRFLVDQPIILTKHGDSGCYNFFKYNLRNNALNTFSTINHKDGNSDCKSYKKWVYKIGEKYCKRFAFENPDNGYELAFKHNHSFHMKFAVLKDSMHIFGGKTTNKKGSSVDLNTKQCTSFSLLHERSWAGVAVNDGSIYICGGQKTNTVERFDPREGRTTQFGSIPFLEHDYTFAAALPNQIYCCHWDGYKMMDLRNDTTWIDIKSPGEGIDAVCLFASSGRLFTVFNNTIFEYNKVSESWNTRQSLPESENVWFATSFE